jgi:hypothetical protein
VDGSGAGEERLLPINVQAVIEPMVRKTISAPSIWIDPVVPFALKWIPSTLMPEISAKESLKTLVSAIGLIRKKLESSETISDVLNLKSTP